MRRSMAALSVLAIALVCVVAMAGASAARAEHRQDAAQYERLLHKYGYNATRAEVEAALGTSFLQVQAKEAGGCEVCMYVIENKQHHQPYLCRGIKDPAYQQTCTLVLVSLMWWLENQVYWLNYGCQSTGEGNQWQWVKPCPAHAVCSWIENLYNRQPFCPPDPRYRKPSA